MYYGATYKTNSCTLKKLKEIIFPTISKSVITRVEFAKNNVNKYIVDHIILFVQNIIIKKDLSYPIDNLSFFKKQPEKKTQRLL